MTVGEALTEARYRAGLTVDEVSERTRIREAVIRCIERDDYDACGGDLYARGYVRAIAGAVGIDAQPLIREFDARRADAAEGAPVAAAVPAGDATVTDLPAITADPALAVADPALTIADPGFTLPDSGPAYQDASYQDVGYQDASYQDVGYQDPGYPHADTDRGYMTAEPVYRVADPTPPALPALTSADATATSTSTGAPAQAPPIVDPFVITPEQVFSASASIYSRPANPSAWRGRTRSRRWVTGVLLLVALAATAAVVAGSHIITGLRHTSASNSAATVRQPKAQASGPAAPGATSAPKPKPKPKPKKTPPKAKQPHPAKRAPVSSPPVHSLPIALAAAFGPEGTSDGDNPQGALFPITPGASLPWQTDWYATPNFGLLKDGTGLLLDMGKTVTITSVRIDLSGYRGANLQLRAASTSISNLHVVARASGVGGTVRLRLAAPVRAKYLLIWFTLLPPNGQGRYQASIYHVVVNGRR